MGGNGRKQQGPGRYAVGRDRPFRKLGGVPLG